ncbi:uncharacterized protein LOC132818312 [Hemiscyllium ocellatum]|uniref:uncharacterized protein LOC132818312 n=1 Tax=Hemiscyllium ocellatum TaxID=170820 RepID=UPI0029662C0E|nr:uncharacterized protein LOC132818312 [Hemiscyllium ocellatum]XP_060685176.1 uncharacterized protein LOC132818312 [Hemiscyllium ocellatum]
MKVNFHYQYPTSPVGATDCQERSAALHLQQDEESDNTNNFLQNMVECFMELNGNMEISVPFDDCGLGVSNSSLSQNCIEEQDLRKVRENQRDTTTILGTEKAISSEALDPNDSTNDSIIGCMEDPVSNMKHILNGADLMGMRKDTLLNASTSKTLCSSKDEENSELWSDFAGYCKTSVVQQQFFGTFHELSLREKDDSAEKSFQHSKIPNGYFTNHHFPTHHHNPTNDKCDNELKTSVSTINACAPMCRMLKLNSSVNTEEDLLGCSNPEQPAVFVDNNFADSAVNRTLGSDTIQTINDKETECSGLGSTEALCPVNPPLSENQAILSASSALKADTRSLLENILQNSFPSEPIKCSFEDIPTLEKVLKIIGEESDTNKANTLTSLEFPKMWEDVQDLNSLSLRFCWNVSHSREKLLSTLGIDQNQKDTGQSDLQFLEDTMACSLDLEKTGALPEVTTVSENGTKALIQTRIPVSAFPRTGRSLTHRLESVVIQWLHLNGNRVREVPRIKKSSLFL